MYIFTYVAYGFFVHYAKACLMCYKFYLHLFLRHQEAALRVYSCCVGESNNYLDENLFISEH